MSEVKQTTLEKAQQRLHRRAEEWADSRAEEDRQEAYEPTYRDGSLKHECWRSEDR